VAAHGVVVPRRSACSNPGCTYVHRMAALVPGLEPLRVDGDLFLISPEAERLKSCCIRAPGHRPPHDVLDPLAGIAV
jgi:hypothetical protein